MTEKRFTLRRLATDLEPTWQRLDDWLGWPPDVFLLTSTVLKSTGAYRYAVSPPREAWPEDRNWSNEVRKEATEWRKWMVNPKAGLPRIVGKCRSVIEACWEQVDLSELRSIPCKQGSDPTPWHLCRAILELHAIADQACRGFGLPAGSYARENRHIRSEMYAVDYLANMLLVMTGSLSRVPRTFGVVLPKMRTPQVGLTLRSLSHHVTFHQSEVDVRWRTMPWINIDENTINLLVVPWPSEMIPTWFRPDNARVKRESPEPARYFAYDRSRHGAEIVEKAISLLEEAEEKVKRVHVIVFPELALTTSELAKLQDLIARRSARDSVPMIIAGLCDEPLADSEAIVGANRVVLSTFFAGKWYDLFQHKHHRWKLDVAQIRQYGLEGMLTGGKDWWESIDIHPRRLTFMAPDGWLTLCPLICEDLARLEPVSELIRGVGPTLLIAILLDGPQIRERWPGRYASVLADDPGTSVLTVSSLGMGQRSTPKTRRRAYRNVALWKDQMNGWSDIKLEEGQEAATITISASWTEEYSADGRGDEQAAAVFVFQGTAGLSGTDRASQRVEDDWEPSSYEKTGDADIDEMTTFAFLVDAALDSSDYIVDNLQRWALGERHEVKDWLESDFRAKHSVWEKFISSPSQLTEEFRYLVMWLGDFLKRVQPDPEAPDDLTHYWQALVEEAGKILHDSRHDNRELRKNNQVGDSLDLALREGFPVHEVLRIQIYTSLSILWAVHRRLSRRRRSSGLTQQTATLLNEIEKLLPIKYDKEWYRARETAAKAPARTQRRSNRPRK